jgi:hypothetical protein
MPTGHRAERRETMSDSTSTPIREVVAIKATPGAGDQLLITARLALTDGTTMTIGFSGQRTGQPGPVTMLVGNIQSRVDQPERFGTTFDKDWVRSFVDGTEYDPIESEVL